LRAIVLADDLSLGGAMKSIIVFRHAAPDDQEIGISDRYGIPGANRLGQQIARVVQGRTCILYSSSVLRAMQTAARVVLAIGVDTPLRKAGCLVYDDAQHRKEIVELVESAWKEYDIVILSTHHPLTNAITGLFFDGQHAGKFPSSRARDLKAFLYAEGLFIADGVRVELPMVDGV
jgi:phosphohistidine phosphatase SixA